MVSFYPTKPWRPAKLVRISYSHQASLAGLVRNLLPGPNIAGTMVPMDRGEGSNIAFFGIKQELIQGKTHINMDQQKH